MTIKRKKIYLEEISSMDALHVHISRDLRKTQEQRRREHKSTAEEKRLLCSEFSRPFAAIRTDPSGNCTVLLFLKIWWTVVEYRFYRLDIEYVVSSFLLTSRSSCVFQLTT
jgi:hypothetical protein